MELCRHLRWKTFSRDDGDPDVIQASLLRGQVPYSCLRTCQSWGPDEQVVAPELCRRRRGCYEVDPQGADGKDDG